jgi:Fe-S cluster assembly iron-binding protein IscA
MIIVTPAAQRQLLQLIADHPEDPVVRLSVKDLDHARIAFNITLESEPHTDDQVQNLDGMQIAVEGRSAARLSGITIDYEEPGGFRFLHPEKADQGMLGVINLN